MKQVPQADITWLAKRWEATLDGVPYPTKHLALRLHVALVATYLRGQGKRSFQKYVWEMATLATKVVQRVVEDKNRDIWFPTLVNLGFTDFEAATKMVKDDVMREGPMPPLPVE